MIRKAMLGLALAVSLLFASQVIASPAMADTGTEGYVTVWQGCGSSDVGYCGAAYPFPLRHGVCQNFPSWFNDMNSAVDNRTNYRARFYRDGNCGVPYWDIYGRTRSGALTSSQGKNAWSSVRFD